MFLGWVFRWLFGFGIFFICDVKMLRLLCMLIGNVFLNYLFSWKCVFSFSFVVEVLLMFCGWVI